MWDETAVGGTGADTFTFGDATDALMAAGGNGADTFNIIYGVGQGPRIVWGGLGADIISLMSPNGDANENWFNPAGILGITVAGLTASSFAALTVDMLGLGSIDLAKLAVIVLNPDSQDRFFVDGQVINASALAQDENLQKDDGGTWFGLQESGWLGSSHEIQAIFEDRLRVTTSPNVNFVELGEAGDGNFIDVNGGVLDEGIWGIIWGDEDTPDVVMTLEEANAFVENFEPETYWYEPESDQPYGPWFALGGNFSGAAFGSDGEFSASAPVAPDLTQWMLAA